MWNELNIYLAEDLMLPPQTLQAAVFGFAKKDNTEKRNTFKLYVYHSRQKGLLNVYELYESDNENKKFEKGNSLYSEKKSMLSIIKNSLRQI